MKPSIAILAAFLLVPCACARHEPAPPQTTFAEPIELRPAAEPQASPTPPPEVAQPEPQPTPEEVAAFHAPVPK